MSDDIERWQPPDAHFRTNHGAYPGFCYACGDSLGIEEMDWNDGLCDTCQGILEDGDDPLDPPDYDDR